MTPQDDYADRRICRDGLAPDVEDVDIACPGCGLPIIVHEDAPCRAAARTLFRDHERCLRDLATVASLTASIDDVSRGRP